MKNNNNKKNPWVVTPEELEKALVVEKDYDKTRNEDEFKQTQADAKLLEKISRGESIKGERLG